MKTYLAILAGVFISTSASADVVATASMQQSNSDVVTVYMTDQQSDHPSCRGKEASAVISYGSMESNLGRGCWSVDGNFISVELYAYSDGREMSFPIPMEDLQVTPLFQETVNAQPVAAVSPAPIENGGPVITDVFAAGSCAMVQKAVDDAVTQEERAFAGRQRADLAASLKVSDADLNGYCWEMMKNARFLVDTSELAHAGTTAK